MKSKVSGHGQNVGKHLLDGLASGDQMHNANRVAIQDFDRVEPVWFISRIIFSSGKNFEGMDLTVNESMANAAVNLKNVGSICVQGNPWLIYPEENFKVRSKHVRAEKYY